MENIPPPVIQKFNINDIPRCPKCNLICLLNLFYNQNQIYIKYYCENEHQGNMLLKDYILESKKFSLSKEICVECKKNQKEVKGDFYYCSKCNKFLCYSCVINHNGNKHNIIQFNRYDALCKIHSNFFSHYCINCKKNICMYCKFEHKNHKLIDLFEYNYFDFDSRNNLEKAIIDLEMKINNIEIIKQRIISLFEELKNSNQLEIQFIKTLLNTYNYEEEYKNLNYNIIQNIKNFGDFKSNKIESFNSIIEEGNKYINLIQKRFNINNEFFLFQENNNEKIEKDKIINMKKCIKTINEHKNCINYLDKLKDGRLISCSDDNTIKIYKKKTFEVQLTIKEHSNNVNSFIQLQDERIVTCSNDKIMKVIRLIEEDKYKVEQKLEKHFDNVYKVIEIKENELISISGDKTMKIWKLNNENKFICINSIIFQNSTLNCNILQLNKREFVTSSCGDKCLKFWNMNNYSLIKTIENIVTYYGFKRMCLLEDDILCVGGINLKGLYLIQISTHQLIKNILETNSIYSIIHLVNGQFLCSIKDSNGIFSIVFYEYEKCNLKKIYQKDNAHDNDIFSCVELFDGTIASGGSDILIKIWN